MKNGEGWRKRERTMGKKREKEKQTEREETKREKELGGRVGGWSVTIHNKHFLSY